MLSKSFLFLLPFLSIHANGLFFEQYRKLYEDGYLTTMEIIKKYDYEGEDHNVTTTDGYILSVHRILPNVKLCNQSEIERRPPVVLLHGLDASSGLFVATGPTNGLGFLLSDQCYDVWMPNDRGSKYSRKHVTFPTQSLDFWDFSFHELGIYDNPNAFDYVMNVTGAKRLLCVCHSQGCTSFFVTASLMPEYTEETIIAAMVMSPISFIGQVRSPYLRALIAVLKKVHINGTSEEILSNDFPPHKDRFKDVFQIICSDDTKIFQLLICEQVAFTVFGNDPGQLNSTFQPILWGHFPEGASAKEYYHYFQLLKSKRFQQYDYGKKENLLRYNSTTPPDYPIEKANVPMAIWYGANDNFLDEDDVKIILKLLPHVIADIPVPWKYFTHADFVTGKDVKALVYNRMIHIMAQY